MKYEMGLKWVDICSNVLKLYSQGIFCPTFCYLKYNIPLVIAQELPLFFVGSLLTQALNQKLMNTLSFLFFVIGSYCYGLNKTLIRCTFSLIFGPEFGKNSDLGSI